MNDEAYNRGYGEPVEKSFYDNPYPEGSTEFRRWVDGKVQAIIDGRSAPKSAGAHCGISSAPDQVTGT